MQQIRLRHCVRPAMVGVMGGAAVVTGFTEARLSGPGTFMDGAAGSLRRRLVTGGKGRGFMGRTKGLLKAAQWVRGGAWKWEGKRRN